MTAVSHPVSEAVPRPERRRIFKKLPGPWVRAFLRTVVAIPQFIQAPLPGSFALLHERSYPVRLVGNGAANTVTADVNDGVAVDYTRRILPKTPTPGTYALKAGDPLRSHPVARRGLSETPAPGTHVVMIGDPLRSHRIRLLGTGTTRIVAEAREEMRDRAERLGIVLPLRYSERKHDIPRLIVQHQSGLQARQQDQGRDMDTLI